MRHGALARRANPVTGDQVPASVDAVCIVNDAVEDGVSDCGLPDHVMPTRDGELSDDDCGAPLIAFLEEIEEIEALLIGQPVGAQVVDDEELSGC